MRWNNRLQAQALTAKNGPTRPRRISVVALFFHSRILHRAGRPVRNADRSPISCWDSHGRGLEG